MKLIQVDIFNINQLADFKLAVWPSKCWMKELCFDNILLKLGYIPRHLRPSMYLSCFIIYVGSGGLLFYSALVVLCSWPLGIARCTLNTLLRVNSQELAHVLESVLTTVPGLPNTCVINFSSLFILYHLGMGSILDRRCANIPCPSIISYTGAIVFAVKILDHSRVLLNAFASALLPPASSKGRGSRAVNTVFVRLFCADHFYYKATECFSLSALCVAGDLHLRAVKPYPARGSGLQLQMLVIHKNVVY